MAYMRYTEEQKSLKRRWFEEKRYDIVMAWIRKRKGEGLGTDEAFAEAREKYPPLELGVVGVEGGGPPGSLERVSEGSFEGRPKSSQRETIEWVARNIAISEVSVEGCPGSEAWAMLGWVRRGSDNETDFWKNIYPKLLPTRTEGVKDSFRDDGGPQLELLEEALREIEGSESCQRQDIE